jgi:chromosome segregation ATPase
MEQEDFTQAPSTNGLAALDQLENRLQSAIEQFRASKQRQTDAENAAAQAQGLLQKKEDEIQRLGREVEQLRSERDEVRGRIETLLGQVESLEA